MNECKSNTTMSNTKISNTMMTTTIDAITASDKRSSLFHFTRLSNLRAIANYDTLLSSNAIHPQDTGERRAHPETIDYGGFNMTINAHLKIVERMFDSSVTPTQFRSYLNRHVFFWPTAKDCIKMLETYTRREPEERFVILQLHAASVLSYHYSSVMLSKYDSGSSPRYPNTCRYKKSIDMFLPLHMFKRIQNDTVPVTPVPVIPSQIREILIADIVEHVSRFLEQIYCDYIEDIPSHWLHLQRPLKELYG
jgi:hypothetical protein